MFPANLLPPDLPSWAPGGYCWELSSKVTIRRHSRQRALQSPQPSSRFVIGPSIGLVSPNPYRTVTHSARQYVDGIAHTNGIESFWAGIKRAYHGTHHWFSHKHLDRYVTEFAGRHNAGDLDTLDMMAVLARGMVGRRLPYAELINTGTSPLKIRLVYKELIR